MHKYRRYIIFASLLTACFALTLVNWVRFALDSSLFSYVLLVPFISGYLIWVRRKSIVRETKAAPLAAAVLGVIAVAFLITAMKGSAENSLTWQILAYCCFLWGGGLALLGKQTLRSIAFPMIFLVFMAPIPPSVVDALEAGLQRGSTEVAYRFIQWAGIPIHRSGFDFHMPGISLTVGKECSGIRSSLVLFITSLVGGYLFCRSAWARWILALFVIPLGIIRNGFRILVLAFLCVRVDPSYIDSPIHRQGGPLFFVLSLIPFGILLYILRRK